AALVGLARFVLVGEHRRLLELGGSGRGPAQPVHGPVAGRRRQPGAGVARDAVARPPLEGDGEGVLRALLGQVPVARDPDEGGDDPSPLLSERLCDGGLDLGRYISQIGLTSIEPCVAPGSFDATSMASSRSLQSTRKNPPSCSLVSAKGPSVVSTSPSRTRTVVASVVGRRRSPPPRTPRLPISSTQVM